MRNPEEIKLRNNEEEKATQEQRLTITRKASEHSKEKMTIDSFEFFGLIGEGSYGSVYMAKKKSTGKMYAIKILEKKKCSGRGRL